MESPFVWTGEDGKYNVARIVGEVDFDAVTLRSAIDYITRTGIGGLPALPLSLHAARRFEALAEEICISTAAEIIAMHWYFTLELTRDVMIELNLRGVPLPFAIVDNRLLMKKYPGE
jgi:hypothetical protein